MNHLRELMMRSASSLGIVFAVSLAALAAGCSSSTNGGAGGSGGGSGGGTNGAPSFAGTYSGQLTSVISEGGQSSSPATVTLTWNVTQNGSTVNFGMPACPAANGIADGDVVTANNTVCPTADNITTTYTGGTVTLSGCTLVVNLTDGVVGDSVTATGTWTGTLTNTAGCSTSGSSGGSSGGSSSGASGSSSGGASGSSSGTTTTGTTTCGFSFTAAAAACASCVSTSCCSQTEACGDDSACTSIISCIQGCASGNTTCEDACVTSASSAAQTEINNMTTCWSNDCSVCDN